MKKLITTALLILCFGVTAAPQTDPSNFLEGIAKSMISIVENNKEALKTDNQLAEKLVREHLLPVIDQEAFAESTLGKKMWAELSSAQKQQFAEQYLQRVINKYAKGLSLYDGQAFVFEPSEISEKSGNARVKSKLKQIGSTPLDIDYILRPINESWLITNMSIAGTSVTKSYKTQFLPRIQEIGFDKFLDELSKEEKTE